MNLTTIADTVLEKTTPVITGIIKDSDGAAIPAASLTALTLTYYLLDAPTNTIINNRAEQNVLNANNVTVGTDGKLTWSLTEADTAVIRPVAKEVHRAVFAWKYASGAKTGRHVIDVNVLNLEKV